MTSNALSFPANNKNKYITSLYHVAAGSCVALPLPARCRGWPGKTLAGRQTSRQTAAVVPRQQTQHWCSSPQSTACPSSSSPLASLLPVTTPKKSWQKTFRMIDGLNWIELDRIWVKMEWHDKQNGWWRWWWWCWMIPMMMMMMLTKTVNSFYDFQNK